MIKMSKKVLMTILFLFGFIETYLIMSFYIPSLKINLIAPPLEYFIKSLGSAYLFKTIISSLTGLVLSGIYLLLNKRRINTKVIVLIVVICLLLILIGVIYSSLQANRF